MDIRKALDTTSSTAQVFVPEVIDGAVRDYAATAPYLYGALPHQPWATMTYTVRKRTARPTAAWRADGGVLPTADNQAFVKVAKNVKYIYARGEVTGPMQAAAGGAYNALADEVQAHADGLVEKVSGDLVTATGAADDIEGLLTQIAGGGTADDLNAGTGDLDVTARVAPANELSLDLLDEALDLGKGTADLMIVGSELIRRKINAMLRSNQRFNDRVEIQAGFRVTSYDGIPMVTVPEWSDDTRIILIRRSDTKILVHQDLTFEELAKTRDSIDFMLKAYLGFAVEGRPVVLSGFTLPA